MLIQANCSTFFRCSCGQSCTPNLLQKYWEKMCGLNQLHSWCNSLERKESNMLVLELPYRENMFPNKKKITKYNLQSCLDYSKDTSTIVTNSGEHCRSSFRIPPSPPPRIRMVLSLKTSLPLPVIVLVQMKSLSARSVQRSQYY